MLKWVAIILGILLLVAGLFRYAFGPSATIAITIASSYATNGGYMVSGAIRNAGAKPAALRATNGVPEMQINVQTGSNMFRVLAAPTGSFDKLLGPGEQCAYSVFVPTNSPAMLYLDLKAAPPFKRKVRSALARILSGGRSGGAEADSSAGTFVRPP